MSSLIALVRSWLRNGDDRPTPHSGCVSPSPATSDTGAARVRGGDGPGPLCSQGCGRPGTCTWECDGDLIFMCPQCCTYCNPGGNIDHEVSRRRMQVGTVMVP